MQQQTPLGVDGATSATMCLQALSDYATSAPDPNALNSYASNEMIQPERCEVCKIECNSKEMLNSHKQGKKHKKNLEKLKAYLALVSPVVPNNSIIDPQEKPKKMVESGTMVDAVKTCEACNVVCNSELNFLDHLAGQKHKKNVEKQKASLTPTPTPVAPVLPNNPIIGPQNKPKKKKAKADEPEDLESKKKKIIEGGTAVNAVKMCELCNVVCNSEVVFMFHLAGHKHLAMLKKGSVGPQVPIARVCKPSRSRSRNSSTASTSSPSPENIPNWVDLPPEVTAKILHLLGLIEILYTARKVCVKWRKICNDPSMWKSIDMRSKDEPRDSPFLTVNAIRRMCSLAVDLSCGLLEKIRIDYFCTEQLLHYIADRSPQLRSLRVAFCYFICEDGFGEVAKKLLNLEELHLFFITMPTEAFECFGRCCPQLKSLTYNNQGSRAPYMEDVGGDKEALAIAQTMPGLRHLSLFGNQMTNKGLQDILNGCPHLESLDLRQCFNVDLSGDLGKTCAQRMKKLMRPNDSTDGYEYDATVDDGYGDSSYDDDEYPSAFSDIDFMSDVDDDYEFSGGGGSDMSNDYDGLFFDY